jgi:hypothetical protein
MSKKTHLNNLLLSVSEIIYWVILKCVLITKVMEAANKL